MHGHRIVEKARIQGLMEDKNNDIKLQNAKLLVKTRTLYLEQNFLNRLCSSGLAATQKEQALEQRFQAMFRKAQLKNMVDHQFEQIQELANELERTRNKIVPALPEVDMSGYNFSIRPLHSEIGREVLEANKMYFRSIGSIPSGL
ncbi:hypothetical protein M758_3G243100 [Ceratodon purpureus]|nr:hypothetical protein M758_3G243100 [Ceratodon purpureus]